MQRKTMALCIYTCDCPISVAIHFNINFSHISHRVFDFCHLICPLSYFITQTSWLHCSAWPQKLLFSHHRMWHTFPPAHASLSHTHTHRYRCTLNLQEKPFESLHLKTIPWARPLTISAPCVAHKKCFEMGKGGGQCLSGTKVNERKCHVVYPIQ